MVNARMVNGFLQKLTKTAEKFQASINILENDSMYPETICKVVNKFFLHSPPLFFQSLTLLFTVIYSFFFTFLNGFFQSRGNGW